MQHLVCSARCNHGSSRMRQSLTRLTFYATFLRLPAGSSTEAFPVWTAHPVAEARSRAQHASLQDKPFERTRPPSIAHQAKLMQAPGQQWHMSALHHLLLHQRSIGAPKHVEIFEIHAASVHIASLGFNTWHANLHMRASGIWTVHPFNNNFSD